MDTNEIIYIGSAEFPTLTFDNESIQSITFDNKVDIVGNELSSDVLEFSVYFDDVGSVLRNLEYGTDVYYYSDQNLVGKYCFSSLKRTGTKLYTVYCTSLIGLIGKEDFYGGFYNNVDFSDVVTDVLFRDNATFDKWTVYAVKPNSSTNWLPQRYFYGDGFDAKYWKFKMQAEFALQNSLYLDSHSSSVTSQRLYICGCQKGTSGTDDGYLVYAVARRATTTSPIYWIVYVVYNSTVLTCGSTDNPLFGIGSRFSVEVDPLNRKIRARVNYVKYDDSSVTGEVSFEKTITQELPTGASVYLGVAWGCAYWATSYNPPRFVPNYVNFNPAFYAYRLYDENGVMVVNIATVQKQSTGNAWYVVNTCNGLEVVAVNTTMPQQYGDPIGYSGGLTRFLRDLELSQNIEYADGIDELDVYGWIDRCTKREALHQLLFAENVSMLKTAYGKILFTSIADGDSTQIDELVCYDDSEEENVSVAKQIYVTEHAYEQVNTSVKIFDNTNSPAAVGEYLAVFDRAPIFGTPTGNGITILAYTSNVALVTGRGTITGTVYNDSQNIIKYLNTKGSDGADISISNIGLITPINSDNVMNRLKAFYCGGVKEVTNSLIYDGEKCGIKYRFKTLYEDVNEGFLSRLSARVSSFVKATCMWITGYIPPKVGGYSAFVIKIAGESFTIPADVRTQQYPNIRVVVIGKGSAGTAGTAGENGEEAEEGDGELPAGQGGAGGSAGTGGQGGLIYSITLDATNISRIDVSASGTNVLAKTYNDNSSLLNTYSSASGNRNVNGHVNILNGSVYGRKGADGIPGGHGGKGGNAGGFGQRDPAPGENVETYLGGTTSGWSPYERYVDTVVFNHYGGGGGAAYGENGGDAYRTTISGYPFADTYGGNGANAGAARVVYPEYGCGGSGGNGGGGGGGAGTRQEYYYEHSVEVGSHTFTQTPGAGGLGSAGADGIQGCVIIYY